MTTTWSGAPVERARAYWGAQLPLPCSKCGEEVTPTDDWDVDHLTPRAEGGALFDLSNTAPAHAHCNRADGARMTNAKRARFRRW